MIRNTGHTMTRKALRIPLTDLFESVGIDPTLYRIESHSICGDPNFVRNNVHEGYLELVLREVHPDETRK